MSNNIWDDVANSFHNVSSDSAAHNKKYDQIAQILISRKIKSLFDIGCGSGLLEAALLKSGYKGTIFAIDGSEKMLELAVSKAVSSEKNIVFKHFLIKNNLPETPTFEAITMVNLLYLLSDKNSILKEIHAKLKSNGTLVIVDPKPRGRIVPMIRENLTGKGIAEIIVYIGRKSGLMVHAVIFGIAQHKLDRQHLKREIEYLSFEELNRILIENSFIIEKTSVVQAGQNWMIVARRA